MAAFSILLIAAQLPETCGSESAHEMKLLYFIRCSKFIALKILFLEQQLMQFIS